MNKYSIAFDFNTNWKPSYRRNYKGKGKKHLLCFPDHLEKYHRSTGFCGQSIKVRITCPKFSNVEIYGRFEYYNDINCSINIMDIVSCNTFDESTEYCSCSYKGSSIVENEYYEINKKLLAWNYDTQIAKGSKMLFCFSAYLFVQSNQPGFFVCLGKVKSPPFSIVSARSSDKSKTIENNIIIPYKESIPTSLSFTLTNNSKLIITSPKLLKLYPFLKPNTLEMNSTLNNWIFNNILLPIDDDSNLTSSSSTSNQISVKNKNIDEFIPGKIVKEMKKFSSMDSVLCDVMKCENDTVYINDDANYPFIAKVINKIEATPTREEISFFGTPMDIAYDSLCSSSYYFLDKYGEKCYFGNPIPSHDKNGYDDSI